MKSAATAIYEFLHRHLILCLVLAYFLGATWPGVGLGIRHAAWEIWSGGIEVTVLKVLLATMLFNAGLAMGLHQLRQLGRNGPILLAVWAAGFAATLLFVAAVAGGVCACSGFSPFTSSLIAGLAVLVAMPAAGSSMAWSQNADGNLVMSLGLVILSTLASPLTAYFAFRTAAAVMPHASAASALSTSSEAITMFLALWVILPAIIGIVFRLFVGAERIERARPYIKIINVTCLLILNYANAALSLPSLLANPAPLQLAALVVSTVAFAGVAVTTAGILAKWFRTDQSVKASLYFGMAMKNNGAGLVLISSTLPVPGPVLLPVIVYNLVQHLSAAIVDRYLLKPNGEGAQGRGGETTASKADLPSR